MSTFSSSCVILDGIKYDTIIRAYDSNTHTVHYDMKTFNSSTNKSTIEDNNISIILNNLNIILNNYSLNITVYNNKP